MNDIINYIIKKERYVSLLSYLLGIMCLAFTIFSLNYWDGGEARKREYVEKIKLKKNISRVVKNGGDLSVVTYAYNNRVLLKYNKNDNYSQEFYYDNESLTLSRVLEDLLADYYSDSLQNGEDSIYCDRLKSIKLDFSRNNPFEELEPEQRINFQNVQAKIPEQYDLIKDDMMLISKTLNEKNALTKEYLQKSTSSFWISIGAVIITLIFGVIQVSQNSSKVKSDEEKFSKLFNKLGEKKE